MIRVDQSIAVHDSSAVSSARRGAMQSATALGLSETAAARAALVATELATNLVKHGGGGSILIGAEHFGAPALVILASDRGRGLMNVAAALDDGYSTAGSSGTGLGAVKRACRSFDVYALPDRGTVLICRVDDLAPPRPEHGLRARIVAGGISIPKRGEEQNGDAWLSVVSREQATICVADGLGHGPAAATASTAAVRVLADRAHLPLEGIMAEMHGALRPTRGAAVGLARIHLTAGRVDFLGVGNIAGTIATDDAVRKTVSLPGIVGHEMRKVQIFSYPWTPSSLIILHSDGVSTSWNAASYPGLTQHDAALVAAVLFRDHCKSTDDATIVVARAA